MKAPRDPRQRPRRGDVLALDGMTIAVQRIDSDGSGGRRWQSVHTRIHCRISDPSAPPHIREFDNEFSPLDFARMYKEATVIRAHGVPTRKP